MMRISVTIASIPLLLAGCADGTMNLGEPPPVALPTSYREITVSPRAGSFDLNLRRNIDTLAEGNVQAVRAHVVATSAARIKTVRQALTGMGLDPAHITASISPVRPASSATVILSRTTVATNDCATAIALSAPDDPMPSLASLSRCVQDNNLAAMIVDPADLVAPSRLGPADGAYLVNGVQSWRGNRQTPSPTANTSNGSNGAGSSVPASGAPPAAPSNSSPGGDVQTVDLRR